MKVILMQDIAHQGKQGDIVNVTDGYARNYLFPRKLALAVTDENKRQIERERAKADAREAEEKTMAEAVASRLETLDLSIARRVGDHETLYGSVTAADIAEAMQAKDFTIDRRKIQLPEPLKTLGEHVVPVKLHREVVAQVKVKVVPA